MIYQNKNRIIWLTGQSGSGKTTLAKELAKDLDCIILDGDEMRECISVEEGLTREDRAKHNYRVTRLANVLSRQKDIVVSVIAPMKAVRRKITEMINPTWIYLKREMEYREGYFYEEGNYFTVNTGTLNITQSSDRINKYLSGIESEKMNYDI